MRRIAEVFESLSSEGSAAYVPYICAGDPNKGFTLRLVETLAGAGADILELGLPFSDPIADGPAIQEAMQRSLSGGFKLADLFQIIASARSREVRIPIVVMTYYNPVVRLGLENFCRHLSQCGADALLVVDLPIEESEELESIAGREGLDLIRLVASSTDDARLDIILEKASGFVYLVSVAGTTGARDELMDSSLEMTRRVSGRSEVPVALGFGISDPVQVGRAVSAGASAVVEGSKLVSIYQEHLDDESRAIESVSRHAREMKKATTRTGPPLHPEAGAAGL